MHLVKKAIYSLTECLTKKSEAEKKIIIVTQLFNKILPDVIILLINDYSYEFYSKDKPDVSIKICLNPGDSQITSVILDHDIIVTGSFYGTLNVWRIETYTKKSFENVRFHHIKTIKAHTTHLSFLTFHPKGFIVSCSTNIIKTWEQLTGNLINVLTTNYDIYKVAFVPSDCSIVSCSWEGSVTLWKINNDVHLPIDLSENTGGQIMELKILEHGLMESIFIMTAYSSVFKIWNDEISDWESFNLSSYVSYCSDMQYVSDIITISLGYNKTSCIDIINVHTKRIMTTIKIENLSCYCVQIKENNKYRVSVGSLYGEIKIWDIDNDHEKLSRNLVFMCDLGNGGYSPFNDLYIIDKIEYMIHGKIAVSINKTIKIISLESINVKNNDIVDIFEEYQVCERSIELNHYINKSYVVSDSLIIFDYSTMYGWR